MLPTQTFWEITKHIAFLMNYDNSIKKLTLLLFGEATDKKVLNFETIKEGRRETLGRITEGLYTYWRI